MPKRIGILGGISHESTAVYYQKIHEAYFARRRDYYYPEVVVYSLDFQKFTDFEDSGDMDGYIRYILSGLNALERAGADFALMAANSPHAVYAEVAERSHLPLLSIVDVTAAHATRCELQRLLLLGIRFTMQTNFYRGACARHGIDVVVPTDAEQALVNSIIFDELVIGDIRSQSRAKLLALIERYRREAGVDGVILGCTELPLILRPEDAELPLLNTLDLHVSTALDTALDTAFADDAATAHPAATKHEWRRDTFVISTDPARLDLDALHTYLTHSYWTPGIPPDAVRNAARHSLCFGLYDTAGNSVEQIGYARVITDYTSFAYMADVFVLPEYRGHGLGVWLVQCVTEHPALRSLRSFWLATRDAHELYRKFGFEVPDEPDKFMVKRNQMPWYRPELAEL